MLTKISFFISFMCILLTEIVLSVKKLALDREFAHSYLRVTRTYSMTGTPKSGVTTLSGISVPSDGRLHTQLHVSPIIPPNRRVSGISVRLFAVRETILVICGTASPMNEIGPQKAVVRAEINPVDISMELRMRLMLNPRLQA